MKWVLWWIVGSFLTTLGLLFGFLIHVRYWVVKNHGLSTWKAFGGFVGNSASKAYK
jgi:hypothetical protein